MTISAIEESVWGSFEECLLPPIANSHYSSLGLTVHVIRNGICSIGLLTAGLLVSCVNLAIKTSLFIRDFFLESETLDPNSNFLAVLNDTRQWEKIEDVEEYLLTHPFGCLHKEFLIGAATCTYQDSGSKVCKDSQWAPWEKKLNIPEEFQSKHTVNLFAIYSDASRWHEITDRLIELNSNCYRCSIEWSQIEPEEGQFNLDVVKTYCAFFQHLRDHDIHIALTLHHFSEPLWFHDKGSFENHSNIDYFVRFTETIFPFIAAEYKKTPLVEYLFPINEPGIEAFERYVLGDYSPGVSFDFHRAGIFLLGELRAYRNVYTKLKELNSKVQIGFIHQHLEMIPGAPIFNPIKYISELTTEVSLRYFKTGSFQLKIPFFCNIFDEGDGTLPETDFVGLNYYARPYANFFSMTQHDEEMTEMPLREDPAGLFLAMVKVFEAFKKPILITENGICTHNEEQRSRYIGRALYSALKAADVVGAENFVGYLYWAFTDNFEWNRGTSKAFGAYEVINNSDGSTEIADHFKPGFEIFVNVAEKIKKQNQEKALILP